MMRMWASGQPDRGGVASVGWREIRSGSMSGVVLMSAVGWCGLMLKVGRPENRYVLSITKVRRLYVGLRVMVVGLAWSGAVANGFSTARDV